MKSMKVSSPPGGCDLCQPPMPAKGNTGGCLHNGWGFVGVLKWHSSVGLGEHRMGNSSWMTHCYSFHWHGLYSTSTLLVIAASFSDWWFNFPPLLLFLHLLSSLFFFFSHFSTYTSAAYLLLRRPQAGDDLRFLEDGLAGELLQYCHDQQAGGSGPGRFLFPLSGDLSSRQWRWMEGMCFWSSFYHLLCIRRAAVMCCVVGGNGCCCLIMTDNLLLWWLCSKVKALMHMKVNGWTL